jgi:Domain of unknown function (DUF4646)
MTIREDKQIDSASLDGDGPSTQLPAYSETDDHSNAGFEMVAAPHSPSTPIDMTAEHEKALLAERDQREASNDLRPHSHVYPSEQGEQQYHTTPPTLPEIYEQPRGGDISTPILFRGLQIPSCRRKVSSGFPYPDMLNVYGISPQEWSTFTSEITQAAQLSSKDWTITVGASIATFAASGIFLGWLGLLPAFVVGHRLRRFAEDKNIRAAKETGDLETKLLRWNETTFAPKGFLVRLDLPGDESTDLDQMDVYTPEKRSRKCRGGRRCQAGGCSGEDRWAKKAEKRAKCSKRKTARRGRIVIVPLNGVNLSMKDLPTDQGEIMDYKISSMSEKGLSVVAVREV